MTNILKKLKEKNVNLSSTLRRKERKKYEIKVCNENDE